MLMGYASRFAVQRAKIAQDDDWQQLYMVQGATTASFRQNTAQCFAHPLPIATHATGLAREHGNREV